MDDAMIEMILELKVERAKLMKALADLEIEKLSFHQLAWTSLTLLRKTRELTQRAHHHLHAGEPDKAQEYIMALLDLVLPDPPPPMKRH